MATIIYLQACTGRKLNVITPFDQDLCFEMHHVNHGLLRIIAIQLRTCDNIQLRSCDNKNQLFLYY